MRGNSHVRFGVGDEETCPGNGARRFIPTLPENSATLSLYGAAAHTAGSGSECGARSQGLTRGPHGQGLAPVSDPSDRTSPLWRCEKIGVRQTPRTTGDFASPRPLRDIFTKMMNQMGPRGIAQGGDADGAQPPIFEKMAHQPERSGGHSPAPRPVKKAAVGAFSNCGH